MSKKKQAYAIQGINTGSLYYFYFKKVDANKHLKLLYVDYPVYRIIRIFLK